MRVPKKTTLWLCKQVRVEKNAEDKRSEEMEKMQREGNLKYSQTVIGSKAEASHSPKVRKSSLVAAGSSRLGAAHQLLDNVKQKAEYSAKRS